MSEDLIYWKIDGRYVTRNKAKAMVQQRFADGPTITMEEDELRRAYEVVAKTPDDVLAKRLRERLDEADEIADELGFRGVFVAFQREGDDVMEVEITKEIGLDA